MPRLFGFDAENDKFYADWAMFLTAGLYDRSVDIVPARLFCAYEIRGNRHSSVQALLNIDRRLDNARAYDAGVAFMENPVNIKNEVAFEIYAKKFLKQLQAEIGER